MGDILAGQIDRHLDRDGGGIGQQHEALQLVVPPLVHRDRLQAQVGEAAGMVALGGDGDRVKVERRLALRGAGVGLEQAVRTIGQHGAEIVADRSELAMSGFGQQRVELSTVNAIFVDLLMMKPGGADQARGPIGAAQAVAQPRIGGELAIVGEPARQGARRHVDPEALLDRLGGARAGLAAIIEHQALDDDLQRIGAALGALRGEGAPAGPAGPELHLLELLAAPALARDRRAAAIDAPLQRSADDRAAMNVRRGRGLGQTGHHSHSLPFPAARCQRPARLRCDLKVRGRRDRRDRHPNARRRFPCPDRCHNGGDRSGCSRAGIANGRASRARPSSPCKGHH